MFQHGIGSNLPDIPFEIVDDEELAAIETAILQAQSLATTPSGSSQRQVSMNSIFPHVSHDLGGANSSSTPTTQRGKKVVYPSASVCPGGYEASPNSGTADSTSSSDLHSSHALVVEKTAISDAIEFWFTLESDSNMSAFLLAANQDDNLLLAPKNELRTSLEGGEEVDMEDLGSTKEAELVDLLERHKSRRGLSVTDFTASEWCEKQVQFSMTLGKPEQTPEMKAGSARHLDLEVEVVTRVEIEIETKEDAWATRLLNFISGARQLLSEGLTRELPVLGIVAGTWVVGFIDEIRLVDIEGQEHPLIVDTKTRRSRYPPSEPQKRNARLQLMCYKLLWDSMVQTGLPSESFFEHFGLRPQQKFCQDVNLHASSFWLDSDVKCLEDLLPRITAELLIYPVSLDHLLLRYEWQTDHSLLGQDEFPFEQEWLMDRWQWHMDFWRGRRDANFVSGDEAWKCRYCSFASVCLPTQNSPEGNGQSSNLPMPHH